MFVWAPIPEPYEELGSLEFAKLLRARGEGGGLARRRLRPRRRGLRALRARRERAAHRPGRPRHQARPHQARLTPRHSDAQPARLSAHEVKAPPRSRGHELTAVLTSAVSHDEMAALGHSRDGSRSVSRSVQSTRRGPRSSSATPRSFDRSSPSISRTASKRTGAHASGSPTAASRVRRTTRTRSSAAIDACKVVVALCSEGFACVATRRGGAQSSRSRRGRPRLPLMLDCDAVSTPDPVLVGRREPHRHLR